jgi:hypothetical protein
MGCTISTDDGATGFPCAPNIVHKGNTKHKAQPDHNEGALSTPHAGNVARDPPSRADDPEDLRCRSDPKATAPVYGFTMEGPKPTPLLPPDAPTPVWYLHSHIRETRAATMKRPLFWLKGAGGGSTKGGGFMHAHQRHAHPHVHIHPNHRQTHTHPHPPCPTPEHAPAHTPHTHIHTHINHQHSCAHARAKRPAPAAKLAPQASPSRRPRSHEQ